jgi:hypothetical protein
MASWAEFEEQASEMARFVRERLESHKHVYLGTLRADGAPRISGIEVTIGAGQIWLGSMSASRKIHDLRRDPRLALHSGSDDPPNFVGDARVSGTAEFIDDVAARRPYLDLLDEAPRNFALVGVNLPEVITVAVAASGDRLQYQIWRPGHAVQHKERI